MRCNNCNNDLEFTLYKKVADWDAEDKKWQRDERGTVKIIVCEGCGSTDVEGNTKLK